MQADTHVESLKQHLAVALIIANSRAAHVLAFSGFMSPFRTVCLFFAPLACCSHRLLVIRTVCLLFAQWACYSHRLLIIRTVCMFRLLAIRTEGLSVAPLASYSYRLPVIRTVCLLFAPFAVCIWRALKNAEGVRR